MTIAKLDEVADFIVAFVGNSYEAYSMVRDETMSWAKTEGKDCSEDLIAEAIHAAVTKGLVSCHRVGSQTGQLEEQLNWSKGDMESTWFHATPEARRRLGLTPER